VGRDDGKDESRDAAGDDRKDAEGVGIHSNYLVFERSALISRAAGEERAAFDPMLEGMRLRGEDFEQQRMLTQEYYVIRPEESLKLIGDLRAILGEHDEAAAAYEKAIALTKSQYRGERPAVLDIAESRALLARKAGDAEAAETIARRMREARLKNLNDVLSFADEAQRLAYRSSIDPWSLFASLGLTEELAATVLQTKGIVLESLLEDRGIAEKSSDPVLAATLEKRNVSRRRLMELLLAGTEAGNEAMAALWREIDDLESLLEAAVPGPGGARAAVGAPTKKVIAALPANGVLIDFIRCRDHTAPGRFTPRYGAVVLKTGNAPLFVPLDTAARIEELMDLYASAVRSEVADEQMSQFLITLGAGLWDPSVPHRPAAGAPIILGPDGAFNFLSFATLLMPEGPFVGENWSLSDVSSGRSPAGDALDEGALHRDHGEPGLPGSFKRSPRLGAEPGRRGSGGAARRPRSHRAVSAPGNRGRRGGSARAAHEGMAVEHRQSSRKGRHRGGGQCSPFPWGAPSRDTRLFSPADRSHRSAGALARFLGKCRRVGRSGWSVS